MVSDLEGSAVADSVVLVAVSDAIVASLLVDELLVDVKVLLELIVEKCCLLSLFPYALWCQFQRS